MEKEEVVTFAVGVLVVHGRKCPRTCYSSSPVHCRAWLQSVANPVARPANPRMVAFSEWEEELSAEERTFLGYPWWKSMVE